MTQVEKIHKEIDTAQDRLLNQVIILISTNEISENLKTKAERLKNSGFINSELVRTFEQKNTQLVITKNQANIINHYKNDYPGYKFLTETEFDRICKKYNLIYAPISNYIKDIPDDNLRDIENIIPLNNNDISKSFYKYTNLRKWRKGVTKEAKNWIINLESTYHLTEEEASSMCPFKFESYNNWFTAVDWVSTKFERDGLFIAAPKSHFNIKGLKKNKKGWFNVSFIVEPKDPIVFRYVNSGIQVITKWGDEANDPNLIIF